MAKIVETSAKSWKRERERESKTNKHTNGWENEIEDDKDFHEDIEETKIFYGIDDSVIV